MGIQQKQPSRSVLRKRCSKNRQQIYRRTPMSKCEFNKLHFGMGVLLYIKFAACTFSEQIFLKTALGDCFWYGMRTVPRLGSSPTHTSARTIPRLTLPQRTRSRLDVSPLRHFAERTFPRPDIFLTTCFSEIFVFSNHFLFACTRIC